MKQLPKWLQFSKEGTAIIPRNRVECTSTFKRGAELKQDRIIIGVESWNTIMEKADFYEVYVGIEAETGEITQLILKPKKIGYIA